MNKTTRVLKNLKYVQSVKDIQERIHFAENMILKYTIKQQRNMSGAGTRSLSIDKAIKHTALQLDRLKTSLKASEQYHDSGHPEEFKNYMHLSDWVDTTERQLKALKTSQRKRVNVYEFSYELIDAIKERVSIIDMVDELKIKKQRSGGDRYVIICPFHDEKTPSCMVYTGEDKFHCFGCGAHGDVIDFYQLYLDIEFDEALMRLCERLEIKILDAEKAEKVEETMDFYKGMLEDAKRDLQEQQEQYAKEIRR